MPTPTPEQIAEQEARWSRTQTRARQATSLREAVRTAMSEIGEQPVTAVATTDTTTRAETSITHSPTCSTLSAAEAEPYIADATLADVAEALKAVMAAHGRAMDAGRIKTVALIVVDQGWKRAELTAVTRVLASSPAVRDNLRYGGTLSPADFEEVRRIEPQDTRLDEHTERTVTTVSGYAIKVRRERLMSYGEMMSLWHATGGQGGPWPTTADFAEAVHVEGEDKPRWRLRG